MRTVYPGQAGSHHNIILTKYVVIDGPRQEQHTALFVFTAVMRSKCQQLNCEPTLHDIVPLYSQTQRSCKIIVYQITFPLTCWGGGEDVSVWNLKHLISCKIWQVQKSVRRMRLWCDRGTEGRRGQIRKTFNLWFISSPSLSLSLSVSEVTKLLVSLPGRCSYYQWVIWSNYVLDVMSLARDDI